MLEGLNLPCHPAEHQVQALQAVKHQLVDLPNASKKSWVARKLALPSPVLVLYGGDSLEDGQAIALGGSCMLHIEEVSLPGLDGVVTFELRIPITSKLEADAPADCQLFALLDGLTLDGVKIFEQFYTRFYA